MRENVFIKIPAQSKYVSLARLAAASIANLMEFDIEAIEDIKVAVGEACSNVVIHGKSDQDFDIKFTSGDNELIIEIEDSGCGFVMEKYKEPELDNPKGAGLGLFIINELMDEVILDSDVGKGTKIKMVKKLLV